MRAFPIILLASACAATPAAPTDSARTGNAIIVCGVAHDIAIRVVLWSDPEGFDATKSAYFGARPGDPRTLEDLQPIVTQVVLHYDVAGTSARCFQVLEKRNLSCHFLLDLDGTIYQTLDLKERAWHAAQANDRSIGIEMANIGAYPDMQVLSKWYTQDSEGTKLAAPGVDARPARNPPITGRIHGEQFHQYDFTNEQYEALAHLLAGLSRVLKIPAVAPPERTVLPDPARPGVVGHFHLVRRKIDPGPAFQWERVMSQVQALLE